MNLVKANLSGADLRLAGLTDANLSEANLSGANLSEANLTRANLAKANLDEANLSEADLHRAFLTGADLREANLSGTDLPLANLIEANLSGADLREARFYMANLGMANLSDANLIKAHLNGANLVEANLAGADLTGCHIYGISAWKLKLGPDTKQQNLVITDAGEPEITVDNIEVAQFVYLLLHNEKIRQVIDTITAKAVLILGRFTPERKAVLDALRDELRKHDLLPIVFDFSISASLDVTQTVKVLAGLARFVIADITDATEVRAELQSIVPDFTKLAIQPILLRGYGEFVSLPGHLRSYPWVLPTFEYDSRDHLIANLKDVVGLAETKVRELRGAQSG